MAFAFTEQLRQAVFTVLGRINPTNGFNTTPVLQGRYRPIPNLDDSQCPGLTVANGAGELDTREVGKFSTRCKADGEYQIVILGWVRAKGSADPVQLLNYLEHDALVAVMFDPVLDGVVDEIRRIECLRFSPWEIRGGDYAFEMTVTYAATVEYASGG